jgi:hypothetical protein
MAENLVKMHKDGKHLDVHPLVVEEHKALGWNVVEEEKAKEPKAPVAPKEPKEPKAPKAPVAADASKKGK